MVTRKYENIILAVVVLFSYTLFFLVIIVAAFKLYHYLLSHARTSLHQIHIIHQSLS